MARRPPLALALLLVAGAAAVPSSAVAATPVAGAERHVEGRLLVRLRRSPAQAALLATALPEFDAACRALGVRSLRPLVAPRRAPRAAPAAFVALGLDRIVRIEVAPADLERVRGELARCADVERVDRIGGVQAAKTPNDPQWNSQWALQAGKLDMPKAWNRLTDATGVPIAVLDSGADLAHSDFRANRWINPGEVAGNGVDDDGNGYVDDRYGCDFVNDDGDPNDDFGHGTEVSGVLGAVGDNAVGTAGVCWKAQVMSCKVLDASGFGAFDQLAEGLIYAVDEGARVANMSFETPLDDATLRAAVDYARAADVVQVAAAGNQGTKLAQYPAAYPGVLGVIATDSNDARWSSSSFGSWCDVAAPGVSILTLRDGGGTTTVTGTSFAAPHVAGIAALMRKLSPDLDRSGVEVIVRASADDLGSAGFDEEFGHGRAQADHALDLATTLLASAPRIQDGGSFTLALSSPSDPNAAYFLFPSFSDRTPGIPLATLDPLDLRTFPLNEDWLFDYVLIAPVNPFFLGFQGTLDLAGAATATVDLPPHAFEGMALDFAFVTFDPNDLAHVRSVSAPARVWID
ncbi:MAG: S8 family serine peptidase [Planctomycetes bacterium]|nr:S8 family serine peptidase [Planctomycetota bacterium]